MENQEHLVCLTAPLLLILPQPLSAFEASTCHLGFFLGGIWASELLAPVSLGFPILIWMVLSEEEKNQSFSHVLPT